MDNRLDDRLYNMNREEPSAAHTGAQERFSESEMAQIKKAFARRFKQAFDDANNAEIARRLKSTDATIKSYTDGSRIPTPEILLQIKRVTGVSIDWLLTGKGQRHTAMDNLFTEDEEAEISAVAKDSKRSFDQTVKSLALAAARFLRNITD